MDNVRYICTRENPWSPEKGERSAHPDAKYLREDIGWGAGESSYEVYKCPWCGLTFEVELPQ